MQGICGLFGKQQPASDTRLVRLASAEAGAAGPLTDLQRLLGRHERGDCRSPRDPDLLEQREGVLRYRVGLCKKCGTGLHQYLRPREAGYLFGDVGVADRRLGGL